MKYPVAERFKAPQGEGLYTGTQMAFMRLVGCSVGKRTCHACDTEFDRMFPDLGGGMYDSLDLLLWSDPEQHVCLTGGEPLDRDLRDLLFELNEGGCTVHIETSGTVRPDWLDVGGMPREAGAHAVQDGLGMCRWIPLWIAVSPKPGYLQAMVEEVADEIKVILGGLGDGPGWPTVTDARRWADLGKTVYLQPRNGILDIDRRNMDEALAVVAKHPELRLSAQLHKYLRTR